MKTNNFKICISSTITLCERDTDRHPFRDNIHYIEFAESNKKFAAMIVSQYSTQKMIYLCTGSSKYITKKSSEPGFGTK